MPYAVAQIFGYETGTAVFVAYLIFIVLQIVLLKGKFPPFQLLQVAASYLARAAERTWASEKIFLISPPSSFPLRSASSEPAAR